MSAVVATPNVADASVSLALSAFPAGGTPVITRSDVNGSRRVRLREGTVITGAGTLVVVDYEPALTDDVDYTATVDASTASSLPVTVFDAGRTLAIVRSAAYPTARTAVDVDAVVSAPFSVDTGAQLHEIKGRPDPIDTGQSTRSRQATVEFLADTWDQARSLEEMVAPRGPVDAPLPPGSRVATVRFPLYPGHDLTLIVTRVTVEIDSTAVRPRRWRVTYEGRETMTGPPILEPA